MVRRKGQLGLQLPWDVVLVAAPSSGCPCLMLSLPLLALGSIPSPPLTPRVTLGKAPLPFAPQFLSVKRARCSP